MPDLRSVLLRPLAAVLATACLAFAAGAADVSQLPPAAPSYDFDKDIKPILEANCVRCHGEARQKSDFRLDTRAGLLRGGEENDKVIVEGHSDKSPLVRMAAGLVEDLQMPPKGKGEPLTARQIGLLRAWIDRGAKWPDGVKLVNTAVAAETAEAKTIIASLPPPAARPIDFVNDIQPLFKGACYQCHGPRKQEAGLRFDHKGTALGVGGDLGPAIVPGKSAESVLIRLVATPGDTGMPREGPRLTTEQIATLRAWIDQGAVWPDAESVVLIDRRNHWAFKTPVRPPLPRVKNTAWAKTPIDAFVLARLEKEGLAPAPEADKATLLRRVSPGPHGPAADDRRRSTRSSPTRRPTRTRSRSSACWRRRTTASAGPGTGSTPRATPTATASRRTSRASSGSIATGSSTPSTATCRTTSSSSSRSPATCCRTPRRTRSSRPASCATR